jgi:hypothetical protein
MTVKLRDDFSAAILLVAAVGVSGKVYSTEHTYLFDLSELTRRIHDDGGLSDGGCLLLVDHYWIWTRGQMMIGAPIRYLEISSQKPVPDAGRDCIYAITLPGREAWFSRPDGPQWRILEKDSHGQLLLKKVSS